MVQLTGAVIAGGFLGTGSATAESATWESVKSPVDVTLYDVETTARNDFASAAPGP
ncbi:MAG: hypothetical protein SVG88_10185 [Halobacteriales archaeon]|nr:hypothetical protein [Halobacteriales archaeon]